MGLNLTSWGILGLGFRVNIMGIQGIWGLGFRVTIMGIYVYIPISILIYIVINKVSPM